MSSLTNPIPGGPSADDLAAMGIELNDSIPGGTNDDGSFDTTNIDLNDPDTAAFLKSFEDAAPTAVELAEKIAADNAPDTTVDVAPDATASTASTATDAPATTDTPATTVTDSFMVDLGNGQTATLTQDDATRLIGLDQWARSLPEATVHQFAAIESGDAVAIPRAQYDQFQVWLAGGTTPATGTPGTPGTSAPSTLPPLDEYADDTTRALYAQVQQLQQQVQQTAEQQVFAQAAAQQAQWQAHASARADVFQDAFNESANQFGLSDAETVAALNFAANSRLVQQVNDELTVMSPTGQVLREADPSEVAHVTFDRAVHTLPDLRNKVIDSQVQARIDSERASISATNQKKNRASSLSTAPAAATSTSRNVRDMTSQEVEAAIAAELRAAMS